MIALISFTSPLSLVGFNKTKTIAADGLVELVSILKPGNEVTNAELCNALSSVSACVITFEVPSKEVPEGVETAMAIKP
ncbi:hypothetical protein D3C86_1792690 [compost metagenome]